jgi:hypothetical protein
VLQRRVELAARTGHRVVSLNARSGDQWTWLGGFRQVVNRRVLNFRQSQFAPKPPARLRKETRRRPGGFPVRFYLSIRRLIWMEQRKANRVVFERGFPANMMAIDGTWRRPCTMEDVSDTGARLTIDGSVEGLTMKEFFLVLSTMGKAYRRCELAWVNGNQVGVHFLKPNEKKKKS